jgi:chaperone modulatory protein CbpM
MKKEMIVISGMVLDESIRLSLGELCQFAKTSQECVIEMVEEGVLDPEGSSIQTWIFDHNALKRLQIALHLQQDLGLNLPGSALVLDLLEEMEQLRRKLQG